MSKPLKVVVRCGLLNSIKQGRNSGQSMVIIWRILEKVKGRVLANQLLLNEDIGCQKQQKVWERVG